jgi:cell division protease FtsH
MNREMHVNFWYVLGALMLVLAFQDLLSSRVHVEAIPYSRFQVDLEAGRIESVEVGQDLIRGSYKDRAADGSVRRFTTVPVSTDLADTLARSKVEFSARRGPGLLERALGWLLPVLLFAGLWLILIRRMAEGGGVGGAMAIGKSKAKVYMEKAIGTTFADVAGVDEAKEELQEVINFLRDPKGYGRLGARVPKGILLVGPPGTGKTLLARAVAGEAGVPFFSISGAEFVELFVGVGAARVRDLFEQARQQAPCIIFIDELDAVGRARGAYLPGGGHDEKEQTLNQLLNEIDGFDPSGGVVLLAATNRPEILDPALLRAGRFDRQVLVDRPDKPARVAILRVHLRKLTLSPDVDIDEIAALTTGFSGADLANLANEAALLATRRDASAVAHADMVAALERIVAGLEKRSRVLSPHERRVTAYHEVGHALVAMALPGSEAIQKVSIIPRGISALGYTIQRPIEDRFLMTKGELENRMAVLLGGRAAEILRFQDVSTGAADDLAKATAIARSMAARYGMVPEVGAASYETEPLPLLGSTLDYREPRHYAEATATAIDAAVKRLIEDALATALRILKHRQAALDAAAARLLECESLSGTELATLAAEVDPAAAATGSGEQSSGAADGAEMIQPLHRA